MASPVDKVKAIAKSVIPKKAQEQLRARYLSFKAKNEMTVAKSLVESPTQLAAIQRSHASANNQRDFLTIDWLRRRIDDVADPALNSYFAIIAHHATPSLCAPPQCYRALINSVIAVSVQSNLEIGYVDSGEVLSISNYAELVRNLHNRRAVEVRLSSDGQVLAFFLERWYEENDTLNAPRPNPVTRKIYLQSPSAQEFLASPGKRLDEMYPTPLLESCLFDVDVVYTWVNSRDPDWQEMLAEHSPAPDEPDEDEEGAADDSVVDADRYASRDELKYSLRSLLRFAPWVRNVYVITNCKPPKWFDESNGRVKWVYHDEIIEPENLPTFSSHAIEASIHRVPGLSEHFLYFNDDLFLVKPVDKADFFLPNGLAKIRPEPYGMLHGEVDPDDADYLNAARNVGALFQAEFGKMPTKLHTHSPQSMRLSVVQRCEATFPEAYKRTRQNKFRSITDISPSSFMYPNFAYVTGNAVMTYPNIVLMNFRKPYAKRLRAITDSMNKSNHSILPLTLCLNDGGGSSSDEGWSNAVTQFMTSMFDEMSEAEKPYETHPSSAEVNSR